MTGVLLEYSDCYNPLRVEQVGGVDIRVSVGDNLGETHTLLVPGILRDSTSWSRLAITYKFDEPELKVIDFWPGLVDPLETVLPICNVDRSRRMNATGEVRLGASYNPDLPSFNGNLGCIQFFRGYLLKNYEAVPEFCDPQLFSGENVDAFAQTLTQMGYIRQRLEVGHSDGKTKETDDPLKESINTPKAEINKVMFIPSCYLRLRDVDPDTKLLNQKQTIRYFGHVKRHAARHIREAMHGGRSRE
ncbi:hypothetical protein ElyMa_001739900 [Elysia marginata]|uniref:Uncharacterized protein n=1 Tax=Elysia marginata TaxID=1093978 RepID=A0AAV4K0F9_9GAST|nr:hypothetical protein ElyMa_001739900 [Elysia marginata]